MNDEKPGQVGSVFEVPGRVRRAVWCGIVAVVVYASMMAGCKITKGQEGKAAAWVLVAAGGAAAIVVALTR